MWTIDDIRALALIIESPNIRMARELGLPSGDHSGVAADLVVPGAVPRGSTEPHFDLLTGVAL